MDGSSRPTQGMGISEREIRELLQSETGKQLIRLLNQKDGSILRQAAQEAKNGHYEKAYEALDPLLKGTDASILAKKLINPNG